jgi:molybdenum cofactor cytidylyltransferase
MADGVGAVLLAAGSGSRLGSRPKSLLRLDGQPLLLRHIAALTGAGLREIVVVTGHHAEPIERLLAGQPVRVVRNPQPETGQTSSQRLGLAALPDSAAAVLVALADQPLIGAPEIADLLKAWRARPAGIEAVFPQVGGERGNPVVFSAAVRAQVLAAGPETGARDWQRAHPQAVLAWQTPNRHYRIDIDTAEDLAAFEARTGRRLRWAD